MYTVVGSDGQEYGPADMGTLSEWIGQGRLLPTTIVIDPVSGRRGQASEFPLLADLLSRVPPTAPPTCQPTSGYGQAPQQPQPMNFGGAAPNYYQRPGMTGNSPRNKIAAGLLALFLGGIGIHQFYLGKTGLGIAMLLLCVLTCGWGGIITGIWALVDAIILLTGGGKDAEGRPVLD